MSSLLFKNNIHNILPVTSTENNVKPINNIRIISNTSNNTDTSSAFMNELNLNTATSSARVSQMHGGNYANSTTSDLNQDIDILVNMLTSESNSNYTNNKSKQSNKSLESKLRKLLNQDGGNNDMNTDDMNTDALENQIYDVINKNKQKGGNGSNFVKLGLAASGAYLAYNMLKSSNSETSEINVNNIIKPSHDANNNMPSANNMSGSNNNMTGYNNNNDSFSPTSSVSNGNFNNGNFNNGLYSSTSPESPLDVANSQYQPFTKQNFNNSPLLTTTSVNNTESSTSSYNHINNRVNQLNRQSGGHKNRQSGGQLNNATLLEEMYGGNHPALVAFRAIVTNIVEKLDIKYNKAIKVASKLQADVKSKNANISHDKLANAAKDLLSKNMKEYQDLAKSLKGKK